MDWDLRMEERFKKPFGEGADARIAGMPQSVCPYDYGMREMRSFWFKGWNDVDKHWGCDVNGLWEIIELPNIKEEATNGNF